MRALIASLLLVASLQAAPVPKSLPPDPLAIPLLGVTESEVVSPSGIVVGTVVRGSSAERAGIKSEDVILKVGNTEADSFPKLQQTIKLYRPGAIISVEIERGGKKQVLKVCLGERTPDPIEEP